MSHDLEDVDLPGDPFYISNVLDLVLFENFDCDLFPCQCVDSLFDLAERAFAD